MPPLTFFENFQLCPMPTQHIDDDAQNFLWLIELVMLRFGDTADEAIEGIDFNGEVGIPRDFMTTLHISVIR